MPANRSEHTTPIPDTTTTGSPHTTAALLFWEKGTREGKNLPLFGYCRYDWKCAATCSKRSVVTCSLTPMYLL